jgi:hypothetical protein
VSIADRGPLLTSPEGEGSRGMGSQSMSTHWGEVAGLGAAAPEGGALPRSLEVAPSRPGLEDDAEVDTESGHRDIREDRQVR